MKKKKEEILQKVVRYYFFSQSRSKKPFFLCGGGGVGEIKLLFKHYLALFVVSIVTKYRFFNDYEVVITRTKLIAKGLFLPDKQTNHGQNVRQSANKALKDTSIPHRISIIKRGNISF